MPEASARKSELIHIVDCGRGPQLSSNRITVQDVLPFYREGASNEQIRRWIPALRDEEIDLLMEYIRAHYDEVLRSEQEIKAYHERMRALQPAWTRANDHLTLEQRKAILREKLEQRIARPNGAIHPAG